MINKPPGMTVNRAETVKERTVQDFAEDYLHLKDLKADVSDLNERYFLQRSGIVHRLDKGTSGVLLIAKTPEAFERMLRQFKERKVEKEYVALVHGRVEPREGVVRLPIGRSRRNRQRFVVDPVGKIAETGWQVEAYYLSEGQEMTLVRLLPKTGRTHQLRVHLAHMGHPVVGDEHYLKPKRVLLDKRFCPRQFLHALTLCVELTGGRKCFTAPLAPDLRQVLVRLRLSDPSV